MTVDINKPCWTKRGGVVTGLRFRDSGLMSGIEALNGEEIGIRYFWKIDGTINGSHSRIWTEEMQLTNTPPADQLREIPEAQSDLTAENTALKAKVAELEVLLRQSHKENAEAWKVAVKWQRVAAKGVAR